MVIANARNIEAIKKGWMMTMSFKNPDKLKKDKNKKNKFAKKSKLSLIEKPNKNGKDKDKEKK
jgi:hypothetical protein